MVAPIQIWTPYLLSVMRVIGNLPVFGYFVGDVWPEGSHRQALSFENLHAVFIYFFFSSLPLSSSIESFFTHCNNTGDLIFAGTDLTN